MYILLGILMHVYANNEFTQYYYDELYDFIPFEHSYVAKKVSIFINLRKLQP